MKKFKEYIKINNQKEVEPEDKDLEYIDLNEEKEEKKMGFIKTHKKGLIAAGIGTLLATGLAVVLKNRGTDDYDDEDIEDSDEIDSDDSGESEES